MLCKILLKGNENGVYADPNGDEYLKLGCVYCINVLSRTHDRLFYKVKGYNTKRYIWIKDIIIFDTQFINAESLINLKENCFVRSRRYF